MTDEFTLRSAVKLDISALRAFEQRIVGAERPYDRTLGAGPIQYYDLEQMIGADHVEIQLASRGDELVGCGFARIDAAKPYLRHRFEGYLGLMYVVPELRGQGVNQRIIQALKTWCRARGVTELRLDVYHANIAAIRAYEKSGFTPSMIEMRASLEHCDGPG